MPTLKENFSTAKKIQIFIEALEAGHEHLVDGLPLVWLDHHITRTEMDDRGEERHYGIHGFAWRYTKIDGGTGEETPHYIGAGDLTLDYLYTIVEGLDERDLFDMTSRIALFKMNEDIRRRRGV